MNKKFSLILIFIVIILLIAGGIRYFAVFNQNIQVGNNYFTLPFAFYESGEDANGINITNGIDIVNIKSYSGDLNNFLNNYTNNTSNQNFTVKKSNLTLGDFPAYKTVAENNSTKIIKFWFANNGSVYEISPVNSMYRADSTTLYLINHMRSVN